MNKHYLIAFVVFLFSSHAMAQPGVYDVTFGNNGIAALGDLD